MIFTWKYHCTIDYWHWVVSLGIVMALFRRRKKTFPSVKYLIKWLCYHKSSTLLAAPMTQNENLCLKNVNVTFEVIFNWMFLVFSRKLLNQMVTCCWHKNMISFLRTKLNFNNKFTILTNGLGMQRRIWQGQSREVAY